MENENILSKICRTCLSQAKLMQTIFEVKVSEEHNVRAIDFIRRLTSIKITKCEDLPSNICIHCIDDLCKAFNFSQMCVNNDIKLKKGLLKDELKVMNHLDIVPVVEGTALNINECKLEISSEIIIIKAEDHDDVEDNDYIPETENIELGDLQEWNNEEKFNDTEESDLIDIHNANKYHECNVCQKVYKKYSLLKHHSKTHKKTQGEFTCNVCSQKFNYLYLLKKHNYKHQDNKPFPCKICDKGCITAESLRRHMKVHDKNYVKKVHVCTVCSKEFPYPSFLAEHMKNHTGERPFLCSLCGKGFRQSGTLQYHMRSHTGNRPYSCSMCNDSFTSPSVLRVHMRRHTGERPYVCDICGMAFRQSTDMKSHRRTHTGDKPALCTICGKRFSSSGQLNIHFRSHTGEKPFLCSTCSKSFTTKTMLIKHERTHTGERPYVCKICSKAFTQSSTLKTHQNIHKPSKIFTNKHSVEGNGLANAVILPEPPAVKIENVN